MTVAIEVKDLSFTHRGQRDRTIQQLDFQIEHDEIFGFLGPSGAGKSTTQKILIGILKKYEGSARVLGHIPCRSNLRVLHPRCMVLDRVDSTDVLDSTVV